MASVICTIQVKKNSDGSLVYKWLLSLSQVGINKYPLMAVISGHCPPVSRKRTFAAGQSAGITDSEPPLAAAGCKARFVANHHSVDRSGAWRNLPEQPVNDMLAVKSFQRDPGGVFEAEIRCCPNHDTGGV